MTMIGGVYLVTKNFDDIKPLIQDDKKNIHENLLSKLTEYQKLYLQLKSLIEQTFTPEHEKLEEIQHILSLLMDYFGPEIEMLMDQHELMNQIVNDNKRLSNLLKQKNQIISGILDDHETEKLLLSQHTLDPLEQILYSFLLGIRALNQEIESESATMYLVSLKDKIEYQLDQLKKTSFHLYPICIHDLGPIGAIKSYYGLLRDIDNITIDIKFQGNLKRQPNKIEMQLYRFSRHLIQIIDTHTTLSQLNIAFNETDNEIVVKFDGEKLVELLSKTTEYKFYKEIVDSIADVHILEEKHKIQIELAKEK